MSLSKFVLNSSLGLTVVHNNSFICTYQKFLTFKSGSRVHFKRALSFDSAQFTPIF